MLLLWRRAGAACGTYPHMGGTVYWGRRHLNEGHQSLHSCQVRWIEHVVSSGLVTHWFGCFLPRRFSELQLRQVKPKNTGNHAVFQPKLMLRGYSTDGEPSSHQERALFWKFGPNVLLFIHVCLTQTWTHFCSGRFESREYNTLPLRRSLLGDLTELNFTRMFVFPPVRT